MRILQVRFKNLNSLVGEWEIDLTHPAFASDGIFAIAGPTGAGKTTILDAICLALYGRTPRLNRVTKSGNEIMSRQTGECFTEVTFETQAGRYRCHWSQHRARKKPDGELQAPKHEISYADSGKISGSKIRDVADQIESVTGMDFDRFTRSMLLAQGGFAAFLQADPDERSPILEQITGTEVYSQISIRVHERHCEERKTLNILEAETKGITILEPEQEKEIEQAHKAKQKKEKDLTAKFADIEKAILWLKVIGGLKKEIVSLADEESKLRSDIEAFKPDREKLKLALSAASLDGAYATLTAIRKQQADDKKALKAEKEALPKLQSLAEKQAESLKLAEQQTNRVKKELKTAEPVIRKVRLLDQKLTDQKTAILEGEESCKKYAAKIKEHNQNKIKAQEKHAEAQKALDRAEDYLKKNAQDEWLIGGLAGVEEQLRELLSRQEEIKEKKAHQEKAEADLQQTIKSHNDCQEQCSIRKQELVETSKKLQQSKDDLSRHLGGRLLREYRTEKETLLRERAFQTKIMELEDHRAKLEDGKHCPLCGATEHPFAEGNVPVPYETDQKIEELTNIINKAEDYEATNKKLEEKVASAQKNLTNAEKQESTAANDNKAAEKAFAEVEKSLRKLHDDFTKRKDTISDNLLPLGIKKIPDADVSSLLESLKKRRNAWQTQVNKKNEVEKQIAELNSEMSRLDAVIETQSSDQAERQKRLENLNKEHTTGSDERKELYGDKNPDDEEQRLHKAISDAESAEKQARDRYNELYQKWNTAKTQAESLKKSINQREPELSKLETKFYEALASVGFSNEEKFKEARLPAEKKNELETEDKKLHERQMGLKAMQKDREKRLDTEMDKKITDRSLDELEPQFKECEASLKELRNIIAGLTHQLSENTTAKERIKEKQTAIDAQKKECRRWENLHELIGSSDGKKYRNFAQGLTFEIMIGHANRQLQKMTDRYLLVRDDNKPLNLNVVDNYQAGEIRSSKNLSGGESFIVSLSLALGLSHMASKNVRVDSLFLDEGFGTLDEEALETALETLACLQQDGKLIGVISHVPALKERIGTQIHVTPQTGGRSWISGPGCGRKPDTVLSI